MLIEAIAHARTPYASKFGVVRQPYAAHEVPGRIVFEAGRAPETFGMDGLVAGSYLWAVWAFSLNTDERRKAITVRPPRLGGKQRMGVFATRSSFRENSLAVSALRVEAPPACSHGIWSIEVSGMDMVDGTPVLSLRPYEPAFDAHPDAAGGWVVEQPWQPLTLADSSKRFLQLVPSRYRDGLVQVLAQDPRPAYAHAADGARLYWIPFAQVAFIFQVQGMVLEIVDAEPLSEEDMEELSRTGTLERLQQRCRPV